MYCSNACQKKDWKAHKPQCAKWKADNAIKTAALAAAGDAESLTELAFMHSEGRGVQKNTALARTYFERAAAMGDANGLFSMSIYADEDGHVEEALRLLSRSAEAGCLQAMHNLSMALSTGFLTGSSKSRVPVDDVAAISWLRKASALGFGDSTTNLGNRYRYGRGVPRDLAAALVFYRKTVETGQDLTGIAALAAAQLLIGKQGNLAGFASSETMSRDPLLPSNPAAALPFFEQAAARGQADAAFSAAVMHMTGFGIEKSILWIRFMKRAIFLESKGAQNFLRNNNLELREGIDDQVFTIKP